MRLLRGEVEQLGAAETLSEEIHFGPSSADVLKYTVSISDDVDSISARFSHNEITILIPKLIVQNWTRGDAVSLTADQEISENVALTILIEKDFVCLERPDDPDNADAFPHPNVNC